MKYLFLDTETRSETDIALGHDLYTRDAECMIVTYAASTFEQRWQDEPARLWEPWKDCIVPNDLGIAIANPEVIVVAHNAAFDRLILQRCFNIAIPLERWRCTMAIACSHGLPGSLELLGEAVGLPPDQRKLVEDKALIDTFCVPQARLGRFITPEEKPDEWQRFCIYATRDTESLRAIYQRLPTVNYAGDNLRGWYLDQLINERGIGFDRQFAIAAKSFLVDAKVASDVVVSRESGGEVHAASQRNRLLRYLREKCNVDIESLRASEVREWLEQDDLDPVVRILLEQRLDAAKSSGAKYDKGLRTVGPGDRIRHTIRWCGAGRTGRSSHRGFQPGNMSRPTLNVRREDGRIELQLVKADYIDNIILPGIYNKAALTNDLVYGGPYEAAALALRHAIVAAPGNELVVGDFKNIESVCTAWVACQDDMLDAFRAAFANPTDKSLDIYRKQFAAFFGMSALDVSDTERQAGKVSKLAFDFGGGVGALVTMAIVYQMDLDPLANIILPRATEEQKAKAYKAWRRAFLLGDDYELDPKVYQACDILKQIYRSTNTKIDQMRRNIDMAVKNHVRKPGQLPSHVARCKIWCTGTYLLIELPNGDRLIYASPRLDKERVEDPDGGEPWITETLTYITVRGKTVRREKAWSGLIVENIAQATANRVLRAALLRVHKDTCSVPAIAAYLATLPVNERTAVCLHVHDEIVLDVPKGSYSKERLQKVMSEREPWMSDLPIAADVWSNVRYGKR